MTPPRPLSASRVLALALLALTACSGGPLPTYRCIRAIDGDNESGGEVASSGSVAYVAGFTTIGVFDLSDPTAPASLAPVAFPQRVEAIATSGNRLVAAGSQVLQVFDISSPKAPVLLGQVQTTTTAHHALATDGHWAYAGTPNGSVMVFDISAATPVYVSQVTVGGSLAITDLLLTGDTLYAGEGVGHSLVPIDVTRRDQPVPHAAVEANGNVLGMALDGATLLTSTYRSNEGPTAQRWDLKSPLAPVLAETATGGCACGAGNVAVQVAVVRGHFLAPPEYGKFVRAYEAASLNSKASTEVAAGCIPERYPITHVHAVGDALVISGGAGIGFLAP